MGLEGYDLIKTRKTAKKRELSTLVIDLERVPGYARAYDPKVRYIGKDMWVTQPRTICWSARWLGVPGVEFASVWEQDDDYLAERSFELFDQADIVVTYFGLGADVPWLRAEWAKRHIGEPSTWKDIDLYRTIKSRFRLTSNSMQAASELLGVQGKNDRYDFRVGDAAVAGDVAAQRRIKRYCNGDTATTEAVHWALLPYIKSYPHVRPYADNAERLCPRCGSEDTEQVGLYTPGTYVYVERRCLTCGGPFKTEFHHRGPSVRAL